MKFSYQIMLFVMSLLLWVTNSYAASVPVTAYQACSNGSLTINYPLRNNTVFVITENSQTFYPTNSNGVFFLESSSHNNVFSAYLADENHTIFAGCRSDAATLSSQKVVVKGLCPANNCTIAK